MLCAVHPYSGFTPPSLSSSSSSSWSSWGISLSVSMTSRRNTYVLQPMSCHNYLSKQYLLWTMSHWINLLYFTNVLWLLIQMLCLQAAWCVTTVNSYYKEYVETWSNSSVYPVLLIYMMGLQFCMFKILCFCYFVICFNYITLLLFIYGAMQILVIINSGDITDIAAASLLTLKLQQRCRKPTDNYV